MTNGAPACSAAAKLRSSSNVRLSTAWFKVRMLGAEIGQQPHSLSTTSSLQIPVGGPIFSLVSPCIPSDPTLTEAACFPAFRPGRSVEACVLLICAVEASLRARVLLFGASTPAARTRCRSQPGQPFQQFFFICTTRLGATKSQLHASHQPASSLPQQQLR